MLFAAVKALEGDAPNVRAVVQYKVRDDDGDHWAYLELAGGRAAAGEGRHDAPSFRLEFHLLDLPDLMSGALSADDALDSGQLRVSGDIGLYAKLAPWLFRSA